VGEYNGGALGGKDVVVRKKDAKKDNMDNVEVLIAFRDDYFSLAGHCVSALSCQPYF